MCNVLLKTLIKFKLKFFGVLIEEEALGCLFHLNVIFASHFHLRILNVGIFMLAFGLETLRHVAFFLSVHYSCFTLVCVKDIIKQIRHSLSCILYPFLETRKVQFTLYS